MNLAKNKTITAALLRMFFDTATINAKIYFDQTAPNQLALHLEPGKLKAQWFELFSCKQNQFVELFEIIPSR